MDLDALLKAIETQETQGQPVEQTPPTPPPTQEKPTSTPPPVEDKVEGTPPPVEDKVETPTPTPKLPGTTEGKEGQQQESKISRKSRGISEDDFVKGIELATKRATEATLKEQREREEAARKEREKQEQQALDVELDRNEKRTLSVLERLEKNDKYKDVSKKYKNYVKEEREFISKWKKEHGDEDYEESKEYQSFFEEKYPDIDEVDFEEAKEDMISELATKKAREELQGKIDSQDRELRKIKIEPTIKSARAEARDEVLKLALGDKAAEFNNKEFAENNPIEAEIIQEAVSTTENLVGTYLNVANQLEVVDINNPTHKTLREFIIQSERDIKGMNLERDGKRFVTGAEYASLSEGQRGNVWTLNDNDIVYLLKQSIGSIAKTKLDTERSRIEKVAAKMGFVRGGGAPIQQQQSSKPSSTEAPGGSARVPGSSGNVDVPDDNIFNDLYNLRQSSQR